MATMEPNLTQLPGGIQEEPADPGTRGRRAAPEQARLHSSPTVRELAGWERGVAEHHAEEVPKCPVLHPEHLFRKNWDLAQIVALLYVAFLVPFRIGFEIDLEPLSVKWTVELILDLYFIVDIIVNFRTGYIDETNTVEMRPNKIARHYAKNWLVIDVVSCLPTSYITQIMEAMRPTQSTIKTPNTKVFKILRLLRLAKLLRLGRLKKIIKRHEEEFENLLGCAKIVLAVMAMCYIAHVVACFWYFVGDDEFHEDASLAPQPGWITRQTVDVWNVTGDRTEIDLITQYWTAYYWAITAISTVGFGDITGQTVKERIFSIIIEIFGCLLFAVLISSLGSMMTGQKLLEEKISRQLAELREFLQAKAIPKQLRIKIRRYMESLYEQNSGFDEQQILRELPPAMAQELLHSMYHDIIKGVPFFRTLEEGAIVKICGLLKPFCAMKDDLIYKRGEVGREMYVIMKGSIEISFTDEATKTLGPGQTFGEGCAVDLFGEEKDAHYASATLGQKERASLGMNLIDPYKREDNAVAWTDCDLKFLTLNDIREVCQDYPAVKAEMRLLQLMFQSDRVHMVQDNWAGQKGKTVTESTVKIAQKVEKKLSKIRSQKAFNEEQSETLTAANSLSQREQLLNDSPMSTSSRLDKSGSPAPPARESPSPRKPSSHGSMSNLVSTVSRSSCTQPHDQAPTPTRSTSTGADPGAHDHSPATDHVELSKQVSEFGEKLAVLDGKISRKIEKLDAALETQGQMIQAMLATLTQQQQPQQQQPQQQQQQQLEQRT